MHVDVDVAVDVEEPPEWKNPFTLTSTGDSNNFET